MTRVSGVDLAVEPEIAPYIPVSDIRAELWRHMMSEIPEDAGVLSYEITTTYIYHKEVFPGVVLDKFKPGRFAPARVVLRVTYESPEEL